MHAHLLDLFLSFFLYLSICLSISLFQYARLFGCYKDQNILYYILKLLSGPKKCLRLINKLWCEQNAECVCHFFFSAKKNIFVQSGGRCRFCYCCDCCYLFPPLSLCYSSLSLDFFTLLFRFRKNENELRAREKENKSRVMLSNFGRIICGIQSWVVASRKTVAI